MATAAVFLPVPFAAQIWLAQMLSYHGIGFAFEALDRSGALSRVKTRPVEHMRYGEIMPRVLANQVLILLPAMLFMEWAGWAFVGPERLPLVLWPLGLIGMTVGHDVVQYVTHRFLLHRPDLMRRFGHALHHSTTASRGISACYMSAADFFFEIVCPYLLPLSLIGGGGTNLVFHCLVVTAGAFGRLYEHSGYDFSLAACRTEVWQCRREAGCGGLRGYFAFDRAQDALCCAY